MATRPHQDRATPAPRAGGAGPPGDHRALHLARGGHVHRRPSAAGRVRAGAARGARSATWPLRRRSRRSRDRHRHDRTRGGESLPRQVAGQVELGYLFLPAAWGHGYAAEACAAALDRFAGAHPGEPVVLSTQTANDRSMRLAARLGFTEVERYEAYGAEQWCGVWFPARSSG
nr:GNAT family N-acetyltransferase [Jiangella sp. DSM 45060]